MKKIIGYGLLAGVLMILLSTILNLLFGLAFPSFNTIYQDTEIFRPMNDPLMILFWIYPLTLGLALAFVWSKTKQLFKEKNILKRASKFAWIYFAVAAIPAFIINISSFNLPPMMVVTWTIMSAFNGLVAGLVFAKWFK